MLKTLSRYIIREHVGPFFFGFFVITLLFILNLLFRDLAKFLSKGLAFHVILEFLFLNLAWMIALAVPMAMLTASLMAFGRLSADHEITAIKASGISLYKILPPVLVVSALLALGLVWFNNHVLPDFNHRARLLATDIARKKPMINLEPGVYYKDIPDYNILVESLREKHGVSYVKKITIDDQSDPHANTTIRADRGEIQLNQENGILEIKLFDGSMLTVDINEPESLQKSEFSEHIIRISMSDVILKRSQSGFRGDREKSSQDLLADVAVDRERIASGIKKLNKRATERLAEYIPLQDFPDSTEVDKRLHEISPPSGEQAGRFASQNHQNSTSPVQKQNAPTSIKRILVEQQQFKRQIDTELNLIKNYRRSISKNMVEVHKKYSIPAACIIFVLIGAPLGMMMRQRGLAAAAVSIVFFILYWACLIGGETLADRQKISPFLAMWSPNIIVGTAGIYLVLRSVRETFTVNWTDIFKHIPKFSTTYGFILEALLGLIFLTACILVIVSSSLRWVSPWYAANILIGISGLLLILHAVHSIKKSGGGAT